MVYYVIKPASVVTGTAKDLSSCKVTRYAGNASLADLQKHVGGNIESYPLDYGDGKDVEHLYVNEEGYPYIESKDVEHLYVNEEGHPCCLGLPRNRIAEKFIRAYTYAPYSEFLVYGPMVVDCADNQTKRLEDLFVEIEEQVTSAAFDKIDEERVKCKGRYPSAPVHEKAFTATAAMIGDSTLRIDDIDHLDFWLEIDIANLVKRAGWVKT